MQTEFVQKISVNTFSDYLKRFTKELGDPTYFVKQNLDKEYFWETENFKFSLIESADTKTYYYQIESFCDKSPLEFQHELRVKPDF